MIVYTIRINYRSGHQEEYDCLDFSVTFTRLGEFSCLNWKPHGDKRPLFVNADEVESVWQMKAVDTEMEDALNALDD